jgi:hypothetical protein
MDRKISTIFQDFRSKISAASLDPDTFLDDVIYHYTSAEALLSILHSGILRARSFIYLNDSSEVTYGRELVEKVIEENLLIEKKGIRNVFLNDLLSWFIPKALSSDLDLGSDLYVTCFCKDGNQLSQWRAYGSSSGGVAIGLDTESMRSKIYWIGNVHYDVRYQKNVIQRKIQRAFESIDQLIPFINQNDTSYNSEILEQFCRHLTNVLMNKICFFKDVAFDEEQEVRAVCWIDDIKHSINEVDFDSVKNHIASYIELIVGEPNPNYPPKLAIRKIWVGPSPNQDQLLKTLKRMLYKFGYNYDVKICPSKIPFR